MKYLAAIVFVLILFGCIREDNLLEKSYQPLKFSTDTIAFDTVFTNIGSATKTLKVYNPNDYWVDINNIYLAGESKQYRLNINGLSANRTKNVQIAPLDSMYIFVEVTVNPTLKNAPILIQDSIVFEAKGIMQDIDLVAFGQDVHFIRGRISEYTNWTNDKPYLVYDSVLLDSGVILSIDEGVVIHFHKNSRMLIQGIIQCNGTMEKPIVFQGDRLEKMYDDVPSQWDGIWIWASKGMNYFYNTEIKNSVVGLAVIGSAPVYPTLQLNNTQIQHCSAFGLWSVGASILATNTVIDDCGEYALFLTTGGEYEFIHCTFANYWGGINTARTSPACMLTNYIILPDQNGRSVIYGEHLKRANFTNSIIYGGLDAELSLDSITNYDFNYKFENCLLKTDTSVHTNNKSKFVDNIVNPAKFSFKNNDKYDFSLDTLSVAKDKGNINILTKYNHLLSVDKNGRSREKYGLPDLGAFEREE